MLKKILLISIIIVLLIISGYVLIPKEQQNKVQNLSSNNIETSKVNTNTTNLTFITNEKNNLCNNGYYYINLGDENYNIKYFDYKAKKEIYLCNKPNCNHKAKDCNSYLDFFGANEIFIYNNSLYLISCAVDTETSDAQGDGGMSSISEMKMTTPSIYKMDLDGMNKTRIFQCPSGVQMQMPYVINNNILYAFLTKTKKISTGTNSTTSLETERKLVKINLDTGKYEEIFDSKNRTMLGIYENNIVWEEIVYKQNPENFVNDDSGYITNINNSTKKIKLLDLSTMKETEIYQDLYKNILDIELIENKVYYLGKDSRKIQYIDIETKQSATLIELPNVGASFQGSYDKKLQYLYYDKSSNEAKVDKAYYIDLETNEDKEFNLFDNNKMFVSILSSNDEYYFVKTGYEMTEEYTTWAGTKQRDILKTNYGLIRKEDYWNSKAEFIDFKNTDD